MACLNGDGSLTVVAARLLAALETVREPQDVAISSGLPLYRVRGGLRDLAQAGLIEPAGSGYAITVRGRTLLAARPHAAS